MRYRLQLLGRPELSSDKHSMLPTSRKGQALIFYLAANSGQAFSRSHLSSLLWCDHPNERARHNFNMMMSRLRNELLVWPIATRGNDLTWDTSAGVEVDLFEFARQAGLHSETEGLRRTREDLRSAAALWRGVFCDGFACDSDSYEEWLEQERLLWERRVLDVLDNLVQMDAAEENWNDVLEQCSRAIAIDGFRESFHRWTMIAYWRRGERPLAVAHYQQLSLMLKRELGVEPDAATTDLFGQIASQSSGGSLGRAASPESPTPLAEIASKSRDPRSRRTPVGAEGLPVTGSTPFVGREGLMNRIFQELRSRGEGRVPFVLINGEAGIGKSRLVGELLRAMSLPQDQCAELASVASIVMGRCSPFGEDLPYAPLVEGISRVIQSVDLDDLDLPELVWRDLGRVVPEIRERMSQKAIDGSQPHDRLRLYQAISRFLRALPGPVAVIIEDLHWVDTETLAALTYLATDPVSGSDIFIIATSRSVDFPPEFAEFAAHGERERRWAQVELGPLSEQETHDLVCAVWGDVESDVAHRIHAEAGGNPLYVLEIARFLREGGFLGGSEPGEGSEHTFPVPPAVGRAVSGRMAGMSAEGKALLAAASIFPSGVSFESLRTTAGLGEDEALNAYDMLHSVDFLRQHEGRVMFIHDIVRRAVANHLSAPRSVALHRRAYEALVDQVTQVGESALAEQLAYHARLGEMWNEASRWGQEAARAAELLFAYPAACRQLDRTLEALERLPLTEKRAETERRVRAWRFRLAYWFDPHQVESTLEEALVNPGVEHEASADELPDVLLARAEPLFMQGEVDAAQPMLERVLALAGEQDAGIRGYALGGMGAIHMIRGDFKKAVEFLDRAAPLLTSSDRRFPGQSVTLATASATALKGDFARAEACLAQLENELGDPGLVANMHGNKAMIAYFQGRWDDAVAVGTQGMELARTVDHHYNEYFCSIWVGAARLHQAGIERALAAHDASMQLAAKARTRIMLDCIHAFKAMALLKRGRSTAATDVARAGVRIAERYGYKLGLALCKEALGHVAAANGDVVTASKLLTEALRCLKAIEAHPFLSLALRRIPPGVRASY